MDEDLNLNQVRVTLHQLSHTFPDDVDVLLVARKASPSSYVGRRRGSGHHPGAPDLHDSSPQLLPDSTEIRDGTYRPTNYASEPVCLGGGVQGTTTSSTRPRRQGPTARHSRSSKTRSERRLEPLHRRRLLPGHGHDHQRLVTPAERRHHRRRVATFAARPPPAHIEIDWRTRSETETLGYNVFRSGSGSTVQVNKGLLQAKASGRARGAAYRLVDRRARPGTSYTYRLQVVALDGSRTWAGSTSLRAR